MKLKCLLPAARAQALEVVRNGTLLVSLIGFCLSVSAGPKVVISEIAPANAASSPGALRDEDNDTSDWIEIGNLGDEPADLQGWYLTDDPLNLRKWRFPARTVPSGGFLVVFASGKNRAPEAGELHTNFKLDSDGEYLALVRPDGVTPAVEFSPAFPSLRANISYGLTMEEVELVPEGATGEAFVPAGSGPPSTWASPDFQPDQHWERRVALGIGFQVGSGQEQIPGAVSVWPLDGSLADVAGSNDLRFSGAAPNYVEGFDGSPGGAVYLDGQSEYLEVPAGSGFPVFNEPAYTVTMWVKGLPQPDYRVYSEGSDRSNTPLFTIGTESRGTRGTVDIYIRRGDGQPVVNHRNSTREAFDGSWHHIAWVDVAGQAALYIDGELDPTDFSYSKPSLALNKVSIGCVLRAAASHFFQGSIDGVAVWRRALTAEEIRALASGVTPGELSLFEPYIATDIASAMHNRATSVYLRIPFNVEAPERLDSLTLRVRYNDGFVAFLNGSVVAVRNAPQEPSWNSTALSARSPVASVRLEEILLGPGEGLLKPGLNVLAFQGLSAALDDSDFLLSPALYGASGSAVYAYFPVPTPGAPNGQGVSGFVSDTRFSPDRGFYEEPFDLTIETNTPGARIYYTLDGTEPSPSNGILYTGPIRIERTAMVRAAAYHDDLLPSNVDTHTYIFLRDVLSQTGAGFPQDWGSHPVDYAMDPQVVNAYADTIEDDLKSIPTLSIVLPVEDIFGKERGLYPNAVQRGPAWERAASVELIYPDGRRGFQVNCGLRMHGGSSRRWQSSPRHSFRLFFRGKYGPTKLRYRLFPDSPVRSFETLILRACYTDSWTCRYNEPRYRPDDSQYLRDQWMRSAQLAMGGLSAHGIYVHLYLDGLYWGLYNIAERPDAEFAASYLGGEPEDYDAIKDGDLISGSWDAWRRMMAMADAGLGSAVAYERIQEYLDLDSFIDYIILHLYGGAEDWPHHNWAAVRNRNGGGFYFCVWDQEIVLDVLNRDYSEKDAPDSPGRLHQRLRANPEYRLRFADHVHRHMVADGVLAPQNAWKLYERLASQIDRAVVGESARWGDYRREPPYTRDVEWIATLRWLRDVYFPQRTAIVLEQFRADGLYPQVSAPVFNKWGGSVPKGFVFRIENPGGSGTVYYTLDGSDPRVARSGAVSPEAQAYTGPFPLTEPVTIKARVRSDGGQWSALAEGTFFMPGPIENLRLTEIMYHPLAEGPVTEDRFEFLEFKNLSDRVLDLTGVQISGGISFIFPEGVLLPGGGFIVVVADPAAFSLRYPGVSFLGPFRGRLANDGERIVVSGPGGEVLLDMVFGDAGPWPEQADGKGRSLVPAGTGDGDPNDPFNWTASAEIGGSPGRDDPATQGVAGYQVPGDYNQDGSLNVADVIALLGYLFTPDGPPLPCGGLLAPGRGALALLDVNGDGGLDISDPVFMLRYLFATGPAPAEGQDCVPIPGCPSTCK